MLADIGVLKNVQLLIVRLTANAKCQSRNSPELDPSILRHRGIWGAADEEVLN